MTEDARSRVRAFLAEGERRPPDLADVLRRLRGCETALREKGVSALWLFGSVARGEATPESDVDVAAEFSPGAEPSLFGLTHVKDDIETALGHRVDFGLRAALTPDAAASAERDFIRVF
jgi:predicted nucleotidyltransferase